MELFFLLASVGAVLVAAGSVLLRKRGKTEAKTPVTAAIRVQQGKGLTASPMVNHQYNR